MNSFQEFSICLADSICADALDMLPDGNENLYHIGQAQPLYKKAKGLCRKRELEKEGEKNDWRKNAF